MNDPKVAAAVADVESRYGKGAVMHADGGPVADVPVIRTGFAPLDEVLCVGGWARGRVHELTGDTGGGKSTIAILSCVQAQREGLTAAIVDFAHNLDVGVLVSLGVDPTKLLVSQPDSGEQGMEIALSLVKSGAVDLVVIDLGEGLVSQAEIEGEDWGHSGLAARLLSQTLRKLTAACSRSNAVTLFVDRPGTTGNALKFYATTRTQVMIDGDAPELRWCKVLKNKLAPPFKSTLPFDLSSLAKVTP